MPTFIVTGCYTAAALKGMIAEPSDRAEGARSVVEATGGKMLAYYATTGATDWMVIVDVSDVHDLLASLMGVGASGMVSNIQTVRAFSAEELMDMQKKAGKAAQSYKSPG
ncbi:MULTISPECIES: GYD domain-containing protein [Roseobacteraceae]|uniref:GYD domain-containing protein n=1 Tax=Roseobacteraceae TaxID=2854170 RepID=UPI00080AB318|nr:MULTISPECIES: GYD domain-containing protein [Roseobacteraceae]ANT61856.1 GYD domain-containing protein [Salipiger sp. CCB-MM3]MCA0997718.1 GYD domain-containing protein [Alloyangia pacifica]NDW01186.1 GYD domain-containing protein [Salipiger sp. PrR002]NDW58850.1 GYD domain-containing protein [Salipiger sp. PrR004]